MIENNNDNYNLNKIRSFNSSRIYSNYKRPIKFLGIIDYKSICFLIIYIISLGYILYFLKVNYEWMIYIYIICVIPVLSLILINSGEQSAIDVVRTIIKYIVNRKVYIKNYEILKKKGCILKYKKAFKNY